MSYDSFTESTARYSSEVTDPNLVVCMYCALGLTGEAGEVADKIKKWHRDGKFDANAIALELGDTLYYLTRLANHIGYTLEDVTQMNVLKLQDRKRRGVIQGSGDNR